MGRNLIIFLLEFELKLKGEGCATETWRESSDFEVRTLEVQDWNTWLIRVHSRTDQRIRDRRDAGHVSWAQVWVAESRGLDEFWGFDLYFANMKRYLCGSVGYCCIDVLLIGLIDLKWVEGGKQKIWLDLQLTEWPNGSQI